MGLNLICFEIQETHGNLADAIELLKSFESSHFAAWSPADAEMVDFGQGTKHMCGSLGRNGACRSGLQFEGDTSSEHDSSLSGVTSENDSSKESHASVSSGKFSEESKGNVEHESSSRLGGMLNLVKRSAFGPSAKCSHHALVPGSVSSLKSRMAANQHFSPTFIFQA